MSDRHKRSEPRTAAELMANLERDPAYVRRRQQRDEAFEEARREYLDAECPVRDEIRALGYAIAQISDLTQPGAPQYPQAVAVLAKWLPLVDDLRVKESIARALAVPWGRPAAPVLIDEFHRLADPSESAVRWAIGNALEAMADDSLFEEFEAIVRERDNGLARQMVVLGFARMENPDAVPLLIEMLDDGEVACSAMMALGRLRALQARPRIRDFLSHPDPSWRDEAKKALARMDR